MIACGVALITSGQRPSSCPCVVVMTLRSLMPVCTAVFAGTGSLDCIAGGALAATRWSRSALSSSAQYAPYLKVKKRSPTIVETVEQFLIVPVFLVTHSRLGVSRDG